VVKYLPSKQGSWVRFPLDATYFVNFAHNFVLLLKSLAHILHGSGELSQTHSHHYRTSNYCSLQQDVFGAPFSPYISIAGIVLD
jgi:hypothetical protein